MEGKFGKTFIMFTPSGDVNLHPSKDAENPAWHQN